MYFYNCNICWLGKWTYSIFIVLVNIIFHFKIYRKWEQVFDAKVSGIVLWTSVSYDLSIVSRATIKQS